MQLRIPPALKNRRFFMLWAGLIISIAGSQMQLAAIHWHIRSLTATPDPMALGGIGLARILPVIVFSMFGGTFADTYNRRTILFFTQSLMALTAGGLAVLTFMDFFATFFASANTMMPIVARDILHVGEVGYGLLISAQAIGSVTAGIIVSQIPVIRKQGPVFLISVIIFGLATVAFGLSNTFALAMLTLIFIGAADTVSTIIRNTIRQLQTPDHIRGRMTSINQVFFQGGPQLGEVESGLVAAAFGVPFAIVSGGFGTIIAASLIMLKWPELRKYDGQ